MVANMIGNMINVLLDPWLIWGGWFVPELGVLGAGLATAISQFFVMLILFVAVSREQHLRTLYRFRVAFAWKPKMLCHIIRYGIPSGVHVCFDCLTFTLFVFLTGRMDELSFAVSNIAFSINHLIFAPLLGIGMAATVVVGQSMGKGDASAALRTTWITLGLAALYILLCVLVIGSFCDSILQLLFPANASFALDDYLHYGRILVAIFLGWAFFDSLNIVLSGALKGTGDTRAVFWIIFVVASLVFVPWSFIGYYFFGIVEMWLGMLFYVIILSMCYLWRFRSGHWKNIRLIRQHSSAVEVTK
jgi:MATE family multidrug resistance protein